MDSKVFKSHQCSLERSYAILIEINSDQELCLFKKKTHSLIGLLVTKIYKSKKIGFLYSITL